MVSNEMGKINLWQEISCPDYEIINQQIQLWVMQQDWILSTKNFWNPVDLKEFFVQCPLFRAWAVDKKFLLSSIAVTVARSQDSCRPHIDAPPARYKLSWPVLNTKGTWNRWFEPLSTSADTIINHLGGVDFLNYDNLTEIARREVLTPCLIDAGIPHDVWFNSEPTFPRIGLQCQLLKEPKKL